MTSSIASLLDDTTPSDSGVQLLDSESSELNESMISSGVFDIVDQYSNESSKLVPIVDETQLQTTIISDINSNIQSVESQFEDVDITTQQQQPQPIDQIPPEMISSTCSTFDTENIVYRRRAKKTTNASKTPKKRVSFHEDILKNTRTDNIHIEHGFITYKNGSKKSVQKGRYSWCSEYDQEDGKNCGVDNITAVNDVSNDYDNNLQYVYRNACSDVLDYGKTDVYEDDYDDEDKIYVKYDNSGIFEYGPPKTKNDIQCKTKTKNNKDKFYKCNCSDSNSSLDSSNDGDVKNDKRTTSNHSSQNYKQSKSNSCECIGETQNKNNNNNIISDNCYYSEPSIEHLDEFNGNTIVKKSVWSKEKKPKSSCLKKTKHNIYTNIVPEYDLNKKMKKFNVHQLSVIDNSKMIFGSLKDIFGISLPERGVPEGSEDLTTVKECIPEAGVDDDENDFTIIQKPRSFLSKSLDGNGGKNKKYIHNVDEQLRRKNDDDLFAPSNHTSRKNSCDDDDDTDGKNQKDDIASIDIETKQNTEKNQKSTYRNKFIINNESTVFEHTGVCYENNDEIEENDEQKSIRENLQTLPIAESTNTTIMAKNAKTQIKQKLSNIFKTFTDYGANLTSPTATTAATTQSVFLNSLNRSTGDGIENESKKSPQSVDKNSIKTSASNTPAILSPNVDPEKSLNNKVIESAQSLMETSTISSCGSDTTTSETNTNSSNNQIKQNYFAKININSIPNSNQSKNNRHLSSPLRKKSLTTRLERNNARMSPDLFNFGIANSSNRNLITSPDLQQTKHLFSDEFDDILTITTTSDTDKTCETGSNSDLVILDYPTNTTTTPTPSEAEQLQYLKPPAIMSLSTISSTSSTSTSKTSLINRFLRNVTQKKILEATIKKNSFLHTKLNNEKKSLVSDLYVKGVKPRNRDLIEDLNAEIAMEIELSSSAISLDKFQLCEHPQPNQINIDIKFNGYGIGVGELSIDLFSRINLNIFRNENEMLMKVFKLYNGYTREGYMTPVLVFLTDKTLYVTDNIRNRLCNKFVLPYSELDVILIGPYGNTVLTSNSARDMQQVLLAGGQYPADGLVSSLELCARRGGSILPAVGQLTLDHLAPLQAFVQDNSNVSLDDKWKYYAVVNVPATSLGSEQEPLGPNLKGPLMHRRVSHGGIKNNWAAGYFLLKAGVLYLFNDSTQKLPTWAVALSECQGARRSMNLGRPYCFELLLRTGSLQLAAPDEYVASDWLQALVQTASGLFEMQEQHRVLGCTLIMTSNHLLTLREDFSSPLRRVTPNSNNNNQNPSTPKENLGEPIGVNTMRKLSNSTILETSSDISSIRSTGSTPTKLNSSTMSTPTKTNTASLLGRGDDEKSYTNMSSFYGKNSGVEILTCASIDEMIMVKISSQTTNWWCILEFECQEVRENSDDLVVFFSTSSEQERFLKTLESVWHGKQTKPFPISVVNSDDIINEHCSKLFNEINRSWEPLLTAALGYPQ
uniref:Putative dual specificity protein kinase splb n=1 Tax=Corethrella appendiculata TaxID=1370023 RepID=W4VRD0_9DIPT